MVGVSLSHRRPQAANHLYSLESPLAFNSSGVKRRCSCFPWLQCVLPSCGGEVRLEFADEAGASSVILAGLLLAILPLTF